MASKPIVRRREPQCRTKVKTGCATCRWGAIPEFSKFSNHVRIRKVKCDEDKPFCQKCVKTGRTCDGYESPFRLVVQHSVRNARTGGVKPKPGSQPIKQISAGVFSEEVDLLNRYFSTKTLFDVNLGCDEEARQVLQASLTDPSIRHAISSLKALREDLETSGNSPVSDADQTSSYHYGLQQYSMALRGLASKLSYADTNGLKSALLCCQVLISIEQVRMNFAAMALHIIRGLRIMHEHRARPHLVAADQLAPAQYGQLAFLDVFVIKLFAAPCKYAEPSATVVDSRTLSPGHSFSPHQQSVESTDFRNIAPNIRIELVKISTLTLAFLDKVSQVKSISAASQLILEKQSLLNSLKSWIGNLERIRAEAGPGGPESIHMSFMRLFYLILKIVLLGELNSSPDLEAELRIANDDLQSIAIDVNERVKRSGMNDGTSSDREESSQVS